MTPIAALAWTSALTLGVTIVCSLVAEARPNSAFDDGSYALFFFAVALLCIFGMARLHAPAQALDRVLGAQPIALSTALLSAMMGALAALPLDAIQRTLDRRWPMSEELRKAISVGLAELGHGPRIAGAVVATFLLPIGYELFFRGALFSLLGGLGARAAATGATLAYVGHYVLASALAGSTTGLRYVPLTLAIALMSTHARVASGSVLAPIGANVAYFAVDAALTVRANHTLDPLVAHVQGRTALPLSWTVGASIGALLCGLGLLLVGRSAAAAPSPNAATT